MKIFLDNIYLRYKSNPNKIWGPLTHEFAGGLTAFVGKNGEGKTTIMKYVAGIGMEYMDVKGSIRFRSENENETIPITEKNRNNYIIFVEDINSGLLNLRVIDYFYVFTNFYDANLCLKNMNSYLKKFNVLQYKEYKLNELSRGTLQKIAIISCLLLEPLCLIFDEPFNGLDPQSRREFRNIIKELENLKKVTNIIIITHELNELHSELTNISIIHNAKMPLKPITLQDIEEKEFIRMLVVRCNPETRELILPFFTNEGFKLIEVTPYFLQFELFTNESHFQELLRMITKRISIKEVRLTTNSAWVDVYFYLTRLDSKEFNL